MGERARIAPSAEPAKAHEDASAPSPEIAPDADARQVPENEVATSAEPAEPPEDTCPPPPKVETDYFNCDVPPPRLKSYDDIAHGNGFSLPVVKDASGNWVPAYRLAMPHHHASTIAWRGYDYLIDSLHEEPVLVIALGLGRLSLEHDPKRGYWFATYRADVLNVCSCKQKHL